VPLSGLTEAATSGIAEKPFIEIAPIETADIAAISAIIDVVFINNMMNYLLLNNCGINLNKIAPFWSIYGDGAVMVKPSVSSIE
jgi:hypothetical protein